MPICKRCGEWMEEDPYEDQLCEDCAEDDEDLEDDFDGEEWDD